MFLFKLPFLGTGETPEPEPEPGNIPSIITHAYTHGSQCQYDFKIEDAAAVAENVADIYCGKRLGKYTDVERDVYEGSWLLGYSSRDS